MICNLQVLKGAAIPSVFPWTREMYKRTTTSQLAASGHQRSDLTEKQVIQYIIVKCCAAQKTAQKGGTLSILISLKCKER